jgi:hypothetical protein
VLGVAYQLGLVFLGVLKIQCCPEFWTVVLVALVEISETEVVDKLVFVAALPW